MSTESTPVAPPGPPDASDQRSWPPGRTFTPDRVPLHLDEHGHVRVTGSRVTLDTIVAEYENGATPEAIAQGYDTVALADVYSIIGFYLRHQDEVREYLKLQAEKTAAAWKRVRAAQPPRPGFGDELKARMARRESEDAPSAS